MRWSHLPVAGGIYDQHPKLIDEWNVLFSMMNRREEEVQKEQERKMQQKNKQR